VLYGPSASFTLLTIVTPGLLCYAMYRAARLWLNEPGAIIAGVQSFLANLDKADVQALGQNLNALLANLNKKISEVPVAELSNQALAFLGDAHAAGGRIDDLLSKPDVEATLRNAASASGRLDGLLADPGLTETVNNVTAISARLHKLVSSGDMDRLVKSLDAKATGWFDIEALPIMQEALRTRLASAKIGFDMGIPFNELNQVFDLGFKPLLLQESFLLCKRERSRTGSWSKTNSDLVCPMGRDLKYKNTTSAISA